MSAILSTPTARHLEVSARLLVEAWVTAYAVSISGGALTIIHSIIRDGVQKMVDEGDGTDAVRIFEAQNNLASFLFRLTQDAKAGYYSEIEQQHVEVAQSNFCPVYPFS